MEKKLKFEIIRDDIGEVIALVFAEKFADVDVIADGFSARVPMGTRAIPITTDPKFEIVRRDTGEQIAVLGASSDVDIVDDDYKIQIMMEE